MLQSCRQEKEEVKYGYKNLLVWKKSDELAFKVYIETKKFPKEEIYGITSQLRRAALSAPTNIVEGSGRQGRKELKHFVNISLGSLAETEYLIDFSLRLGYLEEKTNRMLQSLRQEVGKLLWNFHKSL